MRRAVPLDFDTDPPFAGKNIELLDPDLGLLNPRFGQTQIGDPFRQCFNQVDVARGNQLFDAEDDVIVADHVVDVVGDRERTAADEQFQIEADTLIGLLLVIVDPDSAGQDEILDKDPIEVGPV